MLHHLSQTPQRKCESFSMDIFKSFADFDFI